ncbi:hypothetical protein AGLY_004507 [Aphis glycines]|uniref:Uncharacterized protein n=1 Tax=Aphis glycines TaxID=307491 RepID=A0A6G0TY95_APHGL|nr:hypothetical protein AGLY_004507 [Aphis glycines]
MCMEPQQVTKSSMNLTNYLLQLYPHLDPNNFQQNKIAKNNLKIPSFRINITSSTFLYHVLQNHHKLEVMFSFMLLLENPGQDKLSSSSRSKFGVIRLNASKALSKVIINFKLGDWLKSFEGTFTVWICVERLVNSFIWRLKQYKPSNFQIFITFVLDAKSVTVLRILNNNFELPISPTESALT